MATKRPEFTLYSLGFQLQVGIIFTKSMGANFLEHLSQGISLILELVGSNLVKTLLNHPINHFCQVGLLFSQMRKEDL